MTPVNEMTDTLKIEGLEQHPSLIIDGLGSPVSDFVEAPEGSDVELPGATESDEAEQNSDVESMPREGYDPTYWQAEHDRIAAENQKMKQEYENLSAIRKELEGNPDLIAHMRKFYETPETVTQNTPQTNPALPPQPSDYNVYDAFGDPNSSSFKYRVAMEQAEKENIVKQATTAAQRAMQQAMIQERKKMEEQRAQTELERQKNEFLQRRNLDEATFNKFINDIQNTPATFDQLYDYWEVKTRKGRVEQNARQSIVDQMNRSQGTPGGLAVMNTKPTVERSEADILFDSILREGNKGITDF